ncbi:phosphate propanoyltransferase [Alkalibaculum sp. M08DMB]|uniref:Phosphate propanoyltransferase n=1 Tax=Alkalibaculum sporogenes TaxID=2655001 RepID=A0A6A7K6V0_9FIRM|nr:phosphate propanoyltransferase [Alkalibaculum sporogenes]MPW25170.1 phosphate propanoyltransferase [Alkalibaculum sporogenes]
MERFVPVGISNRHVHLSQKDLEILFGLGYTLTHMKDLSQPGQYACEEKIDVVGVKGTLKGVRILGPVRKDTQIEISVADGFVLGVKAPIRDSGDLNDSPGLKIVGPKGEVELNKGAIIASRHIHMSVEEGEKFNLKDKDIVNVQIEGKRGLIFNNVLVRVNKDYRLELHVDIEEGNAAGLKNGQLVKIV